MSHDSRGALLKKGDRVLVEGVLTEDPSADGGYCNANVKFVTPEQRDPPPMVPPNNVFNTRMLTKVGVAAILFAVLLSLPAVAEAGPFVCRNGSCSVAQPQPAAASVQRPQPVRRTGGFLRGFLRRGR